MTTKDLEGILYIQYICLISLIRKEASRLRGSERKSECDVLSELRLGA